MISISEYLNESLDEHVFELKSQTYLNAAKKAKKLGDPRAEKFLQAFKDNMDKELMNIEGPNNEEKKFNIYYNADKKSILRLKGLDKNNDPTIRKNMDGPTFLAIKNDDLHFSASVYVVVNKDKDRQIFLRKSFIPKDNWSYIVKKFDKIANKIDDSESKNAFTVVQLFTKTSCVEFFYIIDTDNFIPTYLMYKGKSRHDENCLDYYTEYDKIAINTVCKAMNQNHKDI